MLTFGVMKQIAALLFCAVAFPVFASGSQSIDPTKGCKSNPAIVGACFSVRSRISVANGGYPMRIWPIGTRRFLAVLPPENEIAPDSIKDKFSYENQIFADLVVCPFSTQRSGEMQFVCIESATNVRVINVGK